MQTVLSAFWRNSKNRVGKGVSEQCRLKKSKMYTKERNVGGGKKKKENVAEKEGEVESLLSVVTCSTERNNG